MGKAKDWVVEYSAYKALECVLSSTHFSGPQAIQYYVDRIGELTKDDQIQILSHSTMGTRAIANEVGLSRGVVRDKLKRFRDWEDRLKSS